MVSPDPHSQDKAALSESKSPSIADNDAALPVVEPRPDYYLEPKDRLADLYLTIGALAKTLPEGESEKFRIHVEGAEGKSSIRFSADVGRGLIEVRDFTIDLRTFFPNKGGEVSVASFTIANGIPSVFRNGGKEVVVGTPEFDSKNSIAAQVAFGEFVKRNLEKFGPTLERLGLTET